MTRRLALLSITFLFLLVLAPDGWASSFQLSRVVDLNTPIPNGSGNFPGVGPPALSGSNVAFEGLQSFQPFTFGIYLFQDGVLSRVADRNTAIPGGSGNFDAFDGSRLSGTNVAFNGYQSGELQGAYLFNRGPLSVVADRNTPIPGGNGNFSDVVVFGLSGSNVGLRVPGSPVSSRGIYLFHGGVIDRVVDLNTPIPGGSGNFKSIGTALLSVGNVAFGGSDSQFAGHSGIYLFHGGVVDPVADVNTPIPGGSGNFRGFGTPSDPFQVGALSGSNVVFLGFGSSLEGIYLFKDGLLSRVADQNTPTPGGTGTFKFFSNVAISGSTVAFQGSDSSFQFGIYLFEGGVISRVADRNTAIPGGTGTFTDFSQLLLSGPNVAFVGRGSAGQQGIYFFKSGVLDRVVDLNTPIPNGSGNFIHVLFSALSGDSIAFEGEGSGQVGIYLATSLAGTLPLVAAVLPASRSVQVGLTATAFVTIINAGSATATGVAITPQTEIPATFSYQTTDPLTNAVTGTPNTPADIAAGKFQTYVIGLSPTMSFGPTEVAFTFAGSNTAPVRTLVGINTLLLSASATPVPDIVALAASAAPGIVDIAGATGAGAFAVATVNVGADGQITASADTGGASLPVVISICQTNPTTGMCLGAPDSSVNTQIITGQTPTFAIFVQGNGVVPFDPANNRVFVRFKDASGVTRGATSVAARTQ